MEEKQRRWWCRRCNWTVWTTGLAVGVYCPKGHVMKEQQVARPLEVAS